MFTIGDTVRLVVDVYLTKDGYVQNDIPAEEYHSMDLYDEEFTIVKVRGIGGKPSYLLDLVRKDCECEQFFVHGDEIELVGDPEIMNLVWE